MTFSTHRITAAFVASLALTAGGAFAQAAPTPGGTGGSSTQLPLTQGNTTGNTTSTLPGSSTGTGSTTGNTGANASGNAGGSTDLGTSSTQGNMVTPGNTGMGTSGSDSSRINVAASQRAPRADRN